MKSRFLYVGVFVCLCACVSAYLLFHYAEKATMPEAMSTDSNSGKQLSVETLLEKHPLASAAARAEYAKRPVSSWKEWQEAQTEMDVGAIVEKTNGELPDESIARLRKMIYDSIGEKIVAREKLKGTPTPKTAEPLPKKPRFYQGPQTPEALIAEFDTKYSPGWHNIYNIDAHYPRSEWLQRVLDEGAVIKDSGDYMYYLDIRGDLLRIQENPDEWRSGKYGIPVTTNFDEYANGFVQRKVWENSIIQKVSMENPNQSHTTVYFPSNHPDKYLPVVKNMTYVRLDETRDRIKTSGTLLTFEQQMDLLKKGIEPEGIEIVYIDDDYNLLSEPPPLFDGQKYTRENVISFDGIELTPENYEQILKHPMPARWLENYEKRQARDMPPPIPNTDAINTAARDVALQAQEQFRQGLRELERFTNMTDVEVEAELERRFTSQLPEPPTVEAIENKLWSEVQSSVMTPGRFEAALKILEQYGPEEGMRKLTQADPKAAAQVKRILSGASAREQPPEPPTRPK